MDADPEPPDANLKGSALVMDDTFRPRTLMSASAPKSAGAGLRLRINPAPDDACVEVAFLCDLPGFGGPWLTQYAHKVARRVGPVAVLHVDPDRIEIELVTGRDPAHADPAPTVGVGKPGPKHDVAQIVERIGSGNARLIETLTELSRLEDSPVSHWIVALMADRSRETRTVAREFVRWTLLCGGQSLCVEDAAEVLRDLVDGDQNAAERHVSLSLMGCGPELGKGALERVNQLVSWEGGVKLAEGQAQMSPVQTDWIGGFDWTADQWESLYRFFDSTGGMLHDHSAPTPPPTTTSTASATTDGPTRPAEVGVDLSSFVGPDLVCLDARCPRDPLTQIAVGSDGAVHLFRQHRSEAPANAVDEIRGVLAEMLATQAWVREHLAILQLTRRDRTIDPAKPTVIHIMTSHGKAGVDLVHRFGTMAKIHLLQEVPTRTSTVQWVHTELN